MNDLRLSSLARAVAHKRLEHQALMAYRDRRRLLEALVMRPFAGGAAPWSCNLSSKE